LSTNPDEPRPADATVPGEPTAGPEALPAGEGPDLGTPEVPRAATEDYQDRWLRAEAELQNYRRRVQREFEVVRRAAEEAVVMELIAVADDLERALAARPADAGDDGWAQGVALVAQRVSDALARMGIEPVDPAGTAFDPRFHEAILELDAPGGAAPGSVVQVAQKGYRRGERALRAARVVVAREPAAPEA
jgi:molecular chaperone GrpE